MKSHEVFQAIYKDGHAKPIMEALNRSKSQVYRWAETGDGKNMNPLERVGQLWDCTRDERLPQWVCRRAGGTFVPDPPVKNGQPGEPLAVTVSRVHMASADFHKAMARVEADGGVTPEQAEVIRASWQKMKCKAEGFVAACEKGMFKGGLNGNGHSGSWSLSPLLIGLQLWFSDTGLDALASLMA